MELKEALTNIDVTFEEIQTIAKSVAKSYTKELDDIFESVKNVKDLTDSQLKNLIVLISLKTYSFSEVEEVAELKGEIAESLRKEAYTNALLSAEGTAGVKDAQATSASKNEKVAELISITIASILKNKRDEAHRFVAALQAVLFARTQEAKISALNTSEKAAYEQSTV